MQYLTIDEILALQLLRCKRETILKLEKETVTRLSSAKGREALNRARVILERQRSLGIKTMAFHEPCFPSAFKAIGDDCPPLIHLLGNVFLLEREDTIAIIGARKATLMGCTSAWLLGQKYGLMGSVVVSGLALGCDTWAHKGSRDTIAIVATGLDITYPRKNVELQKSILESGRGLLLSEHPLGVKANPSRLVARCRLQAALSQKVIVAESPVQSGTMHTVRFALRYGKPVTAIAYKIWNDFNAGNRYIIDEIGSKETLSDFFPREFCDFTDDTGDL